MKKGFTLLEILIVVAILGVLVLVFIANNKGAVADAEVKKNQMNKKIMGNAMQMYYLDHETLPFSKDTIDASVITAGFKNDMMKKFESLGTKLTESEWTEMVKHFKKIDSIKLQPYVKGHKDNQDYFLVDESAPYFKGYAFSYHSLYKDKKEEEIFDIPFEEGFGPVVEDEKIKPQLLAGPHYGAYLNSKGHVYVWSGWNADIRGGSTSTTPVIKTDGSVLDDIREVYPGYHQALAVTKDKKIYTWGDNFQGLLGLGHKNKITGAQEFILPDGLTRENIKKFSLTNQHVLLLLDNGKVLAWGGNYQGQLGTGNTDNVLSPIYLKKGSGEVFTDIKDVIAGGTSTVLLANDGTVYAAGSNDYGQLGLGATSSTETKFVVSATYTPYGNNIKKLVAGAWHTGALLNDGRIITAGYNASWQLGNSSIVDKSPSVVFVKDADGTDTKNVKDVVSGAYFMYAIKENGDIYRWGSNRNGQLAYSDVGDGKGLKSPEKLTGVTFDEYDAKDEKFLFRQGEDFYMLGFNKNSQITTTTANETISTPFKMDTKKFEDLP